MSTTPRIHGRSSDLPAADPQAEVARLRSTVLGGRGPGAGSSEFLEHTRARRTVGGYPVPALREEVARAAAAARRDPDSLALQVSAERHRLAADLDLLIPRLRSQRLLAASRVRTASPGRRRVRLVSALLAGLLIVRGLVRRRRDH